MSTTYRTYLTLVLSLVAVLPSWAQKLTAAGPNRCYTGMQFRIQYSVDTQDVKDFRMGDIPDGLEVLSGPNPSRRNEIQIINGHVSESSRMTYTFILVANKAGQYTIPPARITAGGKQLTSEPLRINIEGDDFDPDEVDNGATSRQRRSRQEQEMRPAGSNISGKDLYITVTANKQRVKEQEPVLLTYKVYARVALTQLSGKLPDMKGFHTQEIPLPQQKSFSVETVNGVTYNTVTWSQYVLFPQVAGKMQIPSVTFEGIVRQKRRPMDMFEELDAMFNGGANFVEVKKNIVAPGLTLQVDPLPEKPAGFSGGVGSYSISAALDKEEVKAGDPVTLRVVVSGAGNMKLLKEPLVEVPKDFEKYDAKVTDKTKLTTRGLEGNIVYDILLVPRHQGNFEIPAINYPYFDLQTGRYKTLTTQPLALKVLKGAGGSEAPSGFSGQEDVRELAKDIRFIKMGDANLMTEGPLFGSRLYMLAIGLLLLTFIVLMVVFRRRAIENADIVGQRAGRANKVAVKRLKLANKLKKEGKTSSFYDEVLRALWGYVGDKLNIPVEQLSRDNITERLAERQVDNDTIQQFIQALEECEFARYAPGDTKGNMNKVYEKAITAIEKIEGGMKRKPHAVENKAVLLFILLLSTLVASAEPVATDSLPTAKETKTEALSKKSVTATKAMADSAYVQGHYQQAAKLYTALLKQGKNSAVYYNLGNCYYRMEDMTHAVLAYERALKLAPGDEDIRFNLQMAREKTIDKIVPRSEMFFVTWWKALVNMQSADGWAMTAIVSLGMAVVLLLVYLFVEQLWLRKVGFFGGVFAVLLFLLANLLAWQQHRQMQESPGAVVVAPAAVVKSTPAHGGTDLFILHEGTRVDIIDDTMRDWKEVEMADGKRGWIELKLIERI